MLKNFKMTIEYDGTEYHGWQRQKEDRSIQQEIEKAILSMTARQVVLSASGALVTSARRIALFLLLKLANTTTVSLARTMPGTPGTSSKPWGWISICFLLQSN